MYYYVFSRSKGSIKLLRESYEEEYEKITGLTKKVVELLMDSKKINSVIKGYSELQKAIESVFNNNSISAINDIDINDYLSDYLFRVRKYLDNWETHIKRHYGEDSLFLKQFKDTTSYVYDNHMEYRIMYQLRNFDQHCDNIASSISIGLNDNGEKYLKVNLSKDKLLSNYKRWKPIEKSDLASLGETIDALSFAYEYHKCILSIHQKICEFHMNSELYMNCTEVLKCANEYKEDRETIYFVKQENIIDKEFWRQPTKTLNFTSWCVPQCYNLLILHMKNNLSSVKVVYNGDQYELLLKEAAIKVSETAIRGLFHNSSVQGDDGKKYIIGYIQINLDEYIGWAVLIDAQFSIEEISNITNEYKSFVSAIIKE